MNSVTGDRSSGLRPALAVLFLLLASATVLPRYGGSPAVNFLAQRAGASRQISRADELFLEDLQRRSFRYFWDEADPQTGLVPTARASTAYRWMKTIVTLPVLPPPGLV